MFSEENGKRKWTDKIINVEVLNRTIKKTTSCQAFQKDIAFIGNVMRKDKQKYLAITIKIVGKRAQRRILFIDQLVNWTNCENTI